MYIDYDHSVGDRVTWHCQSKHKRVPQNKRQACTLENYNKISNDDDDEESDNYDDDDDDDDSDVMMKIAITMMKKGGIEIDKYYNNNIIDMFSQLLKHRLLEPV